MSKYQSVCAAVVIAAVLATGALPVFAQAMPKDEEVPVPAPIELSPVDKAVLKGLEFLKRQQNPGTGAFHRILGVHSLAAMAFMACGHVPGEGPYHEVVEKAVRHIVAMQDPRGFLTAGGGRMYGHGMATLALGEIVGMTYEDSVKRALPRAINIILQSQAVPKGPQHAGGWRYEPGSTDSDVSVTCWQLIALRAAKDAGIDIPRDAINKAIAYVKRCAHPQGGFGYQSPDRRPTNTVQALVALQMAGDYDAPEVWMGADFFIRNPWRGSDWFYYTVYYATFAMYQCGGKYWDIWRDVLEKAVLPLQRDDGSWPPISQDGARAEGPVYPTAMSILGLGVQYHYLPAYQR